MSLGAEKIVPKYESLLRHFLSSFFEEKKRLFTTAVPKQLSNAKLVEKIGQELTDVLKKEFDKLSDKDFVRPTMQVVASMPKEELAILAEALVNLTALKRKASRVQETVGGPTDVAVISKGDGFIWIKRKHYFDSKYNPAFAANYLMEERK